MPKSDLDSVISDHIKMMESCDPCSSEYSALVRDLAILEETRQKSRVSSRVDPNTVLSALTSLLSIGAVLHYERIGVIASKAFSLATRLRF